MFSRFLNCANITKSCKASHITLTCGSVSHWRSIFFIQTSSYLFVASLPWKISMIVIDLFYLFEAFIAIFLEPLGGNPFMHNVEKWPNIILWCGEQGCSQMNWEAMYSMGAQTRFGQKKSTINFFPVFYTALVYYL